MSPVTGPGTDEAQQFGVVQCAIGGDAQFQAGELCRAQVDCDDVGGPAAEHGQGVVAGGGDRETDVVRLDSERLEQDVGVFPALGVANGGEVGARRDVAGAAGTVFAELVCGRSPAAAPPICPPEAVVCTVSGCRLEASQAISLCMRWVMRSR